MYKLRGWIDEDKINWENVLRQKKALQMSQKYIDKMFERLIVPEPWQQSGIYECEDIVPLLKKYPDKIHWPCLCQNKSPEAIALLEENIDKICWRRLADNPSAIPILEKHLDMLFLDDVSFRYLCINPNPDVIPLIEKILVQAPEKIDWEYLARNPNAMPIIKKNLDKIFGNDRVFHNFLSDNTHPEAISIIEQNMEKVDELSWHFLSQNLSALPILEKNLDKYIPWHTLIQYPNALHLIEKNLDKINPLYLLTYPHTIHLVERIEESRFHNLHELSWRNIFDRMPAYNSQIQKKIIAFLEKYIDKLDFRNLSREASAIPILEKNLDKVHWYYLCLNPEAIHILEKNQDKIDWNSFSYNSEIFDYSYEYLEKRCNVFKEELIQKAMNPKKLQRYVDEGYDMEEFLEFL
jgi:hypothetical protein